LPPVAQNFSPALSVGYISSTFKLKAEEAALTEIVRQQGDNDIIVASKKVRDLYHYPPNIKWAKFPLRGFRNIKLYPDQASLIRHYVDNIKQNGYNDSTFICYSNRTCDIVTSMIRPMMAINGTNTEYIWHIAKSR